MRGYGYSRAFGEKYPLLNAIFRFPLFAAILPGPLPTPGNYYEESVCSHTCLFLVARAHDRISFRPV
jgi:hypothetical protein